jgi:hypothetical protein
MTLDGDVRQVDARAYKRGPIDMNEDDKALMAAINEEADKAEQIKPDQVSRNALLANLARRFPQQSTDKIASRVDAACRRRDVFLKD